MSTLHIRSRLHRHGWNGSVRTARRVCRQSGEIVARARMAKKDSEKSAESPMSTLLYYKLVKEFYGLRMTTPSEAFVWSLSGRLNSNGSVFVELKQRLPRSLEATWDAHFTLGDVEAIFRAQVSPRRRFHSILCTLCCTVSPLETNDSRSPGRIWGVERTKTRVQR